MMFMSGPDDGLEVWLKSNQSKGHAIRDGWEFIIGRREDCDLHIPFDTLVSREHAAIRVTSEDITLVDGGSRNGTSLGDHRVNGTVHIKIGDLFRVGNTWLRLEEVVQ
jgi:pSer/pThr/pTyr-binding forkhead associated (FHA) protein